jgi:hypothetical protein
MFTWTICRFECLLEKQFLLHFLDATQIEKKRDGYVVLFFLSKIISVKAETRIITATARIAVDAGISGITGVDVGEGLGLDEGVAEGLGETAGVGVIVGVAVGVEVTEGVGVGDAVGVGVGEAVGVGEGEEVGEGVGEGDGCGACCCVCTNPEILPEAWADSWKLTFGVTWLTVTTTPL